MDVYDYDPTTHLSEIFDSPEMLSQIPQVLSHINQYKLQVNKDIARLKSRYDATTMLDNDIEELTADIRDVKQSAKSTNATITRMTSSIQNLDCYKKNLVLSMTVFKRLQMLINVNNNLKSIISTHNYREIYSKLGVMKELLSFFQQYKSIDKINQIHLMIVHTQNKLIDDVFIDFEEYLKQEKMGEKQEANLLYGARILELIDVKYKSKLLNWFNNLQLRDLKNIFSQADDEAGSIEGIGRRFIYFNKILKQVQQLKIFPQEWQVPIGIIHEFCKITKYDLTNTLRSRRFNSDALIASLTKTIEFEKQLNSEFPQETEFNLSKVFEPYLSIWVQEQDKYLQAKFLEFASTPQLPEELIKDINASVPNIAVTSIELFKLFQKILTSILKLSHGEVLIQLAKMFNKYLFEYLNRILMPVLPRNDEDIVGTEAIKYLTMLLNTADYIVGNIEEINEKLQFVIQEESKSKLPTLNSDIFLQLVNKSISALLVKLTNDYKPCWREFFNIDWQNMESVGDLSSYMFDIKQITQDNLKMILPLIIRDSYVRNYNDKLVELLVTTIANNLRFVKPLTITSLEQTLLDVISLKETCLKFPEFANKQSSKSYLKYVNTHFQELESILKIIMVPNKPIENYIESYFELIGGRSVSNFIKILNLKKIDKSVHYKYVDNFKLQLSIDDDSSDHPHHINQLLTNLEDDDMNQLGSGNGSGTGASGAIIAAIPGRLSSPPASGVSSPMLLPKMNQFEKNIRELAISGETHVSKLNENFRNFGKFFRKDER
ncbi:VPS53 [Candida oxycetoniae]|uniref:VPS53 n=1 Tax=Candida oxycetoniae TaxID=497107 RepID=A0AAI9SX90_9ASCO|nr:VPS53 [Candida oxycetoniae]KAI3404668.2 VPS53 [Candida oxycetoniae]